MRPLMMTRALAGEGPYVPTHELKGVVKMDVDYPQGVCIYATDRNHMNLDSRIGLLQKKTDELIIDVVTFNYVKASKLGNGQEVTVWIE